MPAYFADAQTWLYVPLAGSGLFVPGLPAVFTDVPFAGRINPPTWTVRYEIIYYGGLGIVWLLGLLRPARLPLLLAAGAAIYCYSMYGIDIRAEEGVFNPKVTFGMCFMIGTAIYFYRHHIPISVWPILLFGLLTFLLYDTGWRPLLSTLAFTSAILWLGLVPKGSILAYNRVGELSFSVYLWHWPIGQTLFCLAPGLAFYEFFDFDNASQRGDRGPVVEFDRAARAAARAAAGALARAVRRTRALVANAASGRRHHSTIARLRA